LPECERNTTTRRREKRERQKNLQQKNTMLTKNSIGEKNKLPADTTVTV